MYPRTVAGGMRWSSSAKRSSTSSASASVFLHLFSIAKRGGQHQRNAPRPEGTRLSGRDEVFTDERFDRIEAFERFAEERGLGLLDVAIGGLAAQPAIASVIAGATKPEQVRANAAASDWVPTDEELAELVAF